MLIILFSVDGVLLLLNLIFAIYISIWYFFRLKVKGPFILLFYIFVDLTTIARIFEMIFIVISLHENRHSDQFYSHLNDQHIERLRSIAYLTFLCLALVVVSTMF